MSPDQIIGSLDAALDLHADDPAATLQRIQGPTGAVLYSITVRAWITAYAPDELSPAIIQGDSKVVLSPTDLVPPWPAGEDGIPRRGDQIIVQGRPRYVVATEPRHIAGVLVRLNVQVRGATGPALT